MKHHWPTAVAHPFILPSLLSADFSKLAEEIHDVEKGGADALHFDVMDGHFVPNLTIGPLVVQSVRKTTKLLFDCHLMVTHPELWIPEFAKAGADVITIHHEAFRARDEKIEPVLEMIRKLGCQVGVSFNPATPVSEITHLLDQVDLVLVMSVNPGFGGQKFMPEALNKVRELVSLRGKRKYLIEIDGGIGTQNIAEVRQAGVDAVVAGSAIFGKKDRAAVIAELRTLSK